MKTAIKTFLSFIVLFSLFFFSEAQAQSSYTYETKYSLHNAYRFEKPHGIQALNNTGWSKITIEVKTKNNFQFNNFNRQVILYTAYILPTDAGTVLKHQAGYSSYFTWSWLATKWVTKEAKSDSREFYNKQTYAVDSKIASPSWGLWGSDDLDVIVTLTIEGEGNISDIKEIKLPGIESDKLVNEIQLYTQVIVTVIKPNGDRKRTIFDLGSTPPMLKVIMGDRVKFSVPSPSTAESQFKPEILGVPSTWIAKFGEETLYYCSPNTTPGEFKAWLGYDTWVHTLWVRDYKKENGRWWNEREEPWVQKGNRKEWTWLAQRAMMPNKNPKQFNWGKTRLQGGQASGGTLTQRASQKEGTLMDILHAWPGWSDDSGNFQEYAGAKYAHGFDADEILYMGGKEVNTTTNAPTSGLFRDTENTDPWKNIPVGEGNAINDVVSAYRKNREFYLNDNSTYSKKYEGYEIQGYGTDESHPNGLADKGTKWANGNVTIKLPHNNSEFKIPLRVLSPFNREIVDNNPYRDRGFYNIIQGPEWPAVETNVEYTIRDIPVNKRDDFVLVYRFSDGFHQERTPAEVTKSTQEIYSFQASEADFEANGDWKVNIDFGKWGYNDLTLYYVPGIKDVVAEGDYTLEEMRESYLTKNQVMVAGKELFYMQLMYVSNWGAPLNEKRGDRQNLITNELRSAGYGYPYTKKAQWDMYTKKHFNRYVFRKASEVTNDQTVTDLKNFALTVYDVDPHTIPAVAGQEWYQPLRKVAKSPSLDYMKESLNYYIKKCKTRDCDNERFGLKQPASEESGNVWTHDWSTKDLGTYQVKVEYKPYGTLEGSNALYFIVEIVDYDTDEKAKIITRTLTQKEKDWVGLLPTDKYRIAEVKSILSRYSYVDGPKANIVPNRFGEDNDFAYDYKWFKKETEGPNNGKITNIANPDKVALAITEYKPDWFPTTWLRHYFENTYTDGQGKKVLPPDINISLIESNINSGKTSAYLDGILGQEKSSKIDHKQINIPWVIVSDMDGKRVRNPPKPIFNLTALWDNKTGIFSGTPSCDSEGCDFYLADDAGESANDTDKDKVAFFQRLKTGKIFIFDETLEQGTSEMSVYNYFNGTVDPNNLEVTRLITKRQFVNSGYIHYNLDASVTYQEIDAFGASGAWTLKDLQLKEIFGDKIGEMQKKLFSTEVSTNGNPVGIGLSGWRFNIGSGSSALFKNIHSGVNTSGITDYLRTTESFLSERTFDETGAPVFIDVNTGAPVFTYNFTKQQEEQNWLIAAKRYGVHHLTAFSNSPSHFLTKNRKTWGDNNLAIKNIPLFADYLVKVLEHFKEKKGIEFDYISPVNEPQYVWGNKYDDGSSKGTTQDGNSMSNADISRLATELNNRIGLSENKLKTKILLAEASKPQALINDYNKGWNYGNNEYERNNGSRNQIEDLFVPLMSMPMPHLAKTVSAHDYWTYVYPVKDGEDDIQLTESMDKAIKLRRELKAKMIDKLPGWKYAQTEFAAYGGNAKGKDPDMDLALQVARTIHLDLTEANASSWYWWLALSPYDYKDGLINYTTEYLGSFLHVDYTKTLYALGHFSRFVRPGMKRIEMVSLDGISAVQAATPDSRGLMMSAYFTPSDLSRDDKMATTVIVAINSSDNNKKVKLASSSLNEDRIMHYYLTDNATSNITYTGEITFGSFRNIPAHTIVTLTNTKLKTLNNGARTIANEKDEPIVDDPNIDVLIYPNPTTSSYVYVKFNAPHTGVVKFEIVDLNGRRVQSIDKQVAQGSQDIELYTGFLASGIYVIKGSGAGVQFSNKLIVNNDN